MVLLRFLFIQAIGIALILQNCLMIFGKNVQDIQSTELSENDLQRVCYNFTEGNPHRKEFYSPNYPNHYPNNTKCILRLSADYGQFIQLDFLDQFKLEESPTCEYDYLEIRDGPYGYSELIDKYCNHNFPPIITSSDRYLWLKFVTDNSIEYAGFRAVYKFVNVSGVQRPPSEECFFHRSGHEGFISKTDIDQRFVNYTKTWGVPIDCIWMIQVQEGWQMYLNFPDFRLSNPNDCQKNYLSIYPQSRSVEHRLAHFCGTTAEPQKSPGHIVHIRYFAHPTTFDDTIFVVHFTAFREVPAKGGLPCDSGTEFDCGDGTCIDKSLKCNRQYNCIYRYDEEPSLCIEASVAGIVLTSEHMIIILVVFFCLVLGMCTSISISCYNKIKERRGREREYKERRSKEASVEGGVDRSIGSPDRTLEAALAAQAAHIGSRRNPNKWAEDDDEGGCYVPEVDLSMFRKHPNGGENIPRSEDIPSRNVFPEAKEAKRSPFICDQKDSIQPETSIPLSTMPSLTYYTRDPAERSITPRGPLGRGPRVGALEKGACAIEPNNEHQCIKNNKANAYAYRTIRNTPNQDHLMPRNPNLSRAEAVIEPNRDSPRQTSMESTRSAPDVIVLH